MDFRNFTCIIADRAVRPSHINGRIAHQHALSSLSRNQQYTTNLKTSHQFEFISLQKQNLIKQKKTCFNQFILLLIQTASTSTTTTLTSYCRHNRRNKFRKREDGHKSGGRSGRHVMSVRIMQSSSWCHCQKDSLILRRI